ncbi:hypothetical protein [Streptomyces sp. NBC_01538]|uniref:hypothetical protein n=1 Tax=Streptomyces sp. NBC_01538 TaxID=2903897 RepID=UPI003863E3FC
MSDTCGPVVRTVAGLPQLAALNSRSYQGGCFGIDAAETRTGGIVARVDDLFNMGTTRRLAVPNDSVANGIQLF